MIHRVYRFSILTLVCVSLGSLFAGKCLGKVVEVPGGQLQIYEALLVSGVDTVLVANNGSGNTPYDAFVMKDGVRVFAKTGFEPEIWARRNDVDTTFAVLFPESCGPSTWLQGFTIKGSDSTDAIVRFYLDGTMKDCVIDANGSLADTAVYAWGEGTHDETTGLTIKMNNTSNDRVGIYIKPNSRGRLDGGHIELLGNQGSTYGVHQVTPVGSSALRGVSVRNFFVTAPNGAGIVCRVNANNHIWAVVDSCTVDGVKTIGIEAGSATAVRHCIATNNASAGDSLIKGLANRISNCITYPKGIEYTTGGSGTGNVVEDPKYCSGCEQPHTVSLDSYALPEHNPTGKKIGLYGLGCMYGDLLRSCEYANDEQPLRMIGSTDVEQGIALTLEEGVVVEVVKKTPPIGLNAYGRLNVNGASGSEVVFHSAESPQNEGDWAGIYCAYNVDAFIEYAEIQHGEYGLYVDFPDTAIVEHCTFTENECVDFIASHVDTSALGDPYYALFNDNTLTVGTGSGIRMYHDSGSLVLSNNVINGNGSSVSGIYSDPSSFDKDPSILANEISGFTNGQCVALHSGAPTLTTNELTESKYGIELTGGSATIGTSSSSSDNIINDNTAGIHHDAGAGVASTAFIQNNQITSNVYGVLNKSGSVDLGGGFGSGVDGNNTITGSSTYCIWNRSRDNRDTVWAEGNYFGTCVGGVPPWCWLGLVDTDRGLCTAPSAVRAEIVEVPQADDGLRLLGVWPNPTRSSNEIAFDVGSTGGVVRVQVFDVAGRLVRGFPARRYDRGEQSVHWDGRGDSGSNVQSGVYFIRIVGADGQRSTAKVLMAR